jgi:hypothetical protein
MVWVVVTETVIFASPVKVLSTVFCNRLLPRIVVDVIASIRLSAVMVFVVKTAMRDLDKIVRVVVIETLDRAKMVCVVVACIRLLAVMVWSTTLATLDLAEMV